MRRTRPSVVAVFGPHGVLAERCEMADGPLTRLRGLMGRRELPAGEGLLLRPSGSVHTCFMRFPIDVVFLGREHEVLGVEGGMRPWRAAGRRGAAAVLELPSGTATAIADGDRLTIEERTHDGV